MNDYVPNLDFSAEEIGRLVALSRDPSGALEDLAELLRQSLGADSCALFLLKPDRRSLVLAASSGATPSWMTCENGRAVHASPELHDAGPLLCDDVVRDPRLPTVQAEDTGGSLLTIPVSDQSVMQGLVALHAEAAGRWSADDVQRLSALVARLGPAFSEARTREQFVAPLQEKLWALARNEWWTWDAECGRLFRDIDPTRWRESGHLPSVLLTELSLDELEERARDRGLHSRVNHAYRRLKSYVSASSTWGAMHAGVLGARPVAYFSAEFGLHESLPIYSGGLGVLAGDHLKSASDLGVPLVGVGLFYGEGYFHQYVDSDGWQQEDYVTTEIGRLPLEVARNDEGRPVIVSVRTRDEVLSAKVWKLTVGRCTLLLLDSNVDGNGQRDLTARLYGGDARMRIQQELLLGVGGMRALRALNVFPGVLHLNEGHSAFAVLEAARQRMEDEAIDFETARRRVFSRSCFTTHTPVPAGHDRFDPGLVEEQLSPLARELGLSLPELLALGRIDPQNHGEPFCMTVLALKSCQRSNAVSSLHGRVSRAMWQRAWPERDVHEVPIGHVTNGVHVPSWLGEPMQELYTRHFGPDWTERSADPELWKSIEEIDDGELWEAHAVLKARLLEYTRQRCVAQAIRRGDPPEQVERYGRRLGPDTLTIGFARRFTQYKRADLVFRDVNRFAELVNDPRRPVQFVFAGKAHPRDETGKALLRRVAGLTRDPRLAGKLMFVEDYDIDVGRHLVQGVDVWLNTPRRPMEASGTSGQKVVLNGGLNLSVLDGWWAEAFDGGNGFAIGRGLTHASPEVQDRRDADDLYAALHEQVVPTFYERETDGLPHRWIARMKRAIRTLGWRFNADRMVIDYVTGCYLPAAGGTSSSARQ